MLDNLNPRERLFIIGGGTVLLFVLLFFGFRMILLRRQKIHDDAIQAKARFSRIERMAATIKSLPPADKLPGINELKAEVFSRSERFNLKPDIKEHVEQPSRDEKLIVLDLNIQGAILKDVIDFLHDIEYKNSIKARVRSINLKRSLPGREIYDVKMSLNAIHPE